jgi:Type II secretory pathway, component PulF
MSSFECRVVDAKGERKTFSREAVHKAAVVRDLNQEGFFILSIEQRLSLPDAPTKGLKGSTLLEFTQVLATLMANGLQLKDALSIARQLGTQAAAPLFEHVEGRVAKGDSLYDSLLTWQSSIPPIYLGLVRIGEKTGDLATVFQRLGEYLAGRQAMRTKMINSLVYPLFVLGVAVAGIVLLVTIILPKMTGMISSLNPEAAAAYMRNITALKTSAAIALLLALVLFAAIVAFARIRSRNGDWGRRIDASLLKIPVVASFLRCSFGLNFSFAMETLLASGYSLEDALEESAFVVGNKAYRAALGSARENVIKGRALSSSLAAEKIFPQVLTGWMAVGEGANDLLKSFAQVKAYYQKATDSLYSRFMSLTEPALIVAVGAILITLILTFITPIFTMMGNLL